MSSALCKQPSNGPTKGNICSLVQYFSVVVWYTPKRAFQSVARSFQYSPMPSRIVEDIMEFLESIDLVVESEGTYVDLNVRNGRRLLNFGSVSDTMKNRLRPTRTKEASIASLEDLHPDAICCSERNLQTLQQNNLKVVADGSEGILICLGGIRF